MEHQYSDRAMHFTVSYLASCADAQLPFWNRSTIDPQPLQDQLMLLMVHSCYASGGHVCFPLVMIVCIYF